MPGPYNLPTNRTTGGGSPAADMNAANAALNEATDAATPNVLVLRDAQGQTKFADPVDAADAATRGWVLTQTGLLVPKSVVDAKGDLLVGTAADTISRLGVGTNGQVLTADSAQATGLKWATPAAAASGGGFPVAVPAIDEWAPAPFQTDVSASAGTPSGSVYFPYLPGTYDATLIKITTAGAGETLTVTFYQADDDYRQSATVVGTVNISAASSGVIIAAFTAPITIPSKGMWAVVTTAGSVARVWNTFTAGGPSNRIGIDTNGGRALAILENNVRSTMIAIRRLT